MEGGHPLAEAVFIGVARVGRSVGRLDVIGQVGDGLPGLGVQRLHLLIRTFFGEVLRPELGQPVPLGRLVERRGDGVAALVAHAVDIVERGFQRAAAGRHHAVDHPMRPVGQRGTGEAFGNHAAVLARHACALEGVAAPVTDFDRRGLDYHAAARGFVAVPNPADDLHACPPVGAR